MVRVAIAGAMQTPDLVLSGSAEGLTPSRTPLAPEGQPWQPGKLPPFPPPLQGIFLSLPGSRESSGEGGLYLLSPSEGRMMTMNTRNKKHLCMVS